MKTASALTSIESPIIKIDMDARKIYIGSQMIILRNKEFNLLKYFFINTGKIVSRTQILEEVWDRNICCATNTVDVHVSSLRHKLRSYFGRNLIRTVYCIGYIFEP